MREALKTNISKYGPKTNAAMTVENVQGKGLQLVVIYAGRKHYLPLSSVPMNADTHANHPNHQKIKVDHNGNVGINDASPDNQLHVTNTSGVTKEVVKLEQLDDDEPFILFSGTVASDDSNSISSSNGTTGNKIGAVKVAVDGEGVGWIRLYDDAV